MPVKACEAFLTMSLAVLGAADVEASQGTGVGDGYVGARTAGFDDTATDSVGTVVRPRTIIPGKDMARGATVTGPRVAANIVFRSSGTTDFGQAGTDNLGTAGISNGGARSQGNSSAQRTRPPMTNAARIGDTSSERGGVYNQFAFGVTAAAVNSAYLFDNSLHVNRPNDFDNTIDNDQLLNGSYDRPDYPGGYGNGDYALYPAYRGNGGDEDGYFPFVYGNSVYYRTHPSFYAHHDDYAGYGSSDFGDPSSITVVVKPAVYEYSHPLTNQAAAPVPAVVDHGDASFDAARAAFKSGDYSKALELTERATRQTPNDANMQNLRGLVLFALHRYEDAAAPINAVLSAAQRWDWQKLAGLYPNVTVYTEQLRALESFCNVNPRSAAGRFVLAYMYVTQGNSNFGVDQLKQVVALQPQNDVAVRLIEQLGKNSNPE